MLVCKQENLSMCFGKQYLTHSLARKFQKKTLKPNPTSKNSRCKEKQNFCILYSGSLSITFSQYSWWIWSLRGGHVETSQLICKVVFIPNTTKKGRWLWCICGYHLFWLCVRFRKPCNNQIWQDDEPALPDALALPFRLWWCCYYSVM